METLALLGALFASAFLAATVLPGGSEVVLYTLIASDPGVLWPALAVATVGNTLGALTSYAIGRLLPQRGSTSDRALAWIRRGGAPVLLLSWVPIIGDALCVASGWLRIPVGPASLFIAAGKLARYWVVAQAAL